MSDNQKHKRQNIESIKVLIDSLLRVPKPNRDIKKIKNLLKNIKDRVEELYGQIDALEGFDNSGDKIKKIKKIKKEIDGNESYLKQILKEKYKTRNEITQKLEAEAAATTYDENKATASFFSRFKKPEAIQKQKQEQEQEFLEGPSNAVANINKKKEAEEADQNFLEGPSKAVANIKKKESESQAIKPAQIVFTDNLTKKEETPERQKEAAIKIQKNVRSNQTRKKEAAKLAEQSRDSTISTPKKAKLKQKKTEEEICSSAAIDPGNDVIAACKVLSLDPNFISKIENKGIKSLDAKGILKIFYDKKTKSCLTGQNTNNEQYEKNIEIAYNTVNIFLDKKLQEAEANEANQKALQQPNKDTKKTRKNESFAPLDASKIQNAFRSWQTKKNIETSRPQRKAEATRIRYEKQESKNNEVAKRNNEAMTASRKATAEKDCGRTPPINPKEAAQILGLDESFNTKKINAANLSSIFDKLETAYQTKRQKCNYDMTKDATYLQNIETSNKMIKDVLRKQRDKIVEEENKETRSFEESSKKIQEPNSLDDDIRLNRQKEDESNEKTKADIQRIVDRTTQKDCGKAEKSPTNFVDALNILELKFPDIHKINAAELLETAYQTKKEQCKPINTKTDKYLKNIGSAYMIIKRMLETKQTAEREIADTARQQNEESAAKAKQTAATKREQSEKVNTDIGRVCASLENFPRDIDASLIALEIKDAIGVYYTEATFFTDTELANRLLDNAFISKKYICNNNKYNYRDNLTQAYRLIRDKLTREEELNAQAAAQSAAQAAAIQPIDAACVDALEDPGEDIHLACNVLRIHSSFIRTIESKEITIAEANVILKRTIDSRKQTCLTGNSSHNAVYKTNIDKAFLVLQLFITNTARQQNEEATAIIRKQDADKAYQKHFIEVAATKTKEAELARLLEIENEKIDKLNQEAKNRSDKEVSEHKKEQIIIAQRKKEAIERDKQKITEMMTKLKKDLEKLDAKRRDLALAAEAARAEATARAEAERAAIEQAARERAKIPPICLSAENEATNFDSACKVLGLDPNFIYRKDPRILLRKTYLNISKICHPDKSKADTTRHFQNIETAYTLLQEKLDEAEARPAAATGSPGPGVPPGVPPGGPPGSPTGPPVPAAPPVPTPAQIDALKEATLIAMRLFEIPFNKTFFKIITPSELFEKKRALIKKLENNTLNPNPSGNTLDELTNIIIGAHNYLAIILENLSNLILGNSLNHLPLESLNTFYTKLNPTIINKLLNLANFVPQYKQLNFNESTIILRPRINQTRKVASTDICKELGQLNPLINSLRGIPSQMRKLTRRVNLESIQKNIKIRTDTKATLKAKADEEAKQAITNQMETTRKSIEDKKQVAIQARINQLSEEITALAEPVPGSPAADRREFINRLREKQKELANLKRELTAESDKEARAKKTKETTDKITKLTSEITALRNIAGNTDNATKRQTIKEINAKREEIAQLEKEQRNKGSKGGNSTRKVIYLSKPKNKKQTKKFRNLI